MKPYDKVYIDGWCIHNILGKDCLGFGNAFFQHPINLFQINLMMLEDALVREIPVALISSGNWILYMPPCNTSGMGYLMFKERISRFEHTMKITPGDDMKLAELIHCQKWYPKEG